MATAIGLIAAPPAPAATKDKSPARREKRGRVKGSRDERLDAADPDMPGSTPAEKERFLRGREQYIMQRRGLPYPAGRPNPRSLAIRQMEAQERKLYGRRAQTQFLPRERATTLSSTSWTSTGPEPIPNGQTIGTTLPVSGRVTSIAVHPANANVVYAGTASGGLYRSLDGGSTWTQLMDGALSLAIGSVAIDPVTPSTVVVGTGEDNGFFGVGVYKITGADGVTPVLSGPFGGDVFAGASITKVLVSPTDDNIVFVSTIGGTGGRGYANPAVVPARGLFRSTNFMSGSPLFTKLPITAANGGNRRVTDMVFEPGNPDNLIVNVGGDVNGINGPDGGLYRVTSASGAAVYTQTLNIGGFANAKFAINKVGSTVTVLAATEESVCPNAGGVLRRSVDGGQTWSGPLPSPDISGFCGSQCFFDIGVAIDPTNAGNILLGGQYDDNSASSCRSSTQLRSTDGGVNFTRAATGLHPDTHAIVYAPSNPTIVYAGNDGGIFKSTDSGATWSSLNNAGFSATQFFSISSHPLERFFAIGGTQDNGTEMMDAGGSWTRADFGDGGFAIIDRNAGDLWPLLMYHTYYNLTNTLIGFGRVTSAAGAHDNGWTVYGYGGWNNGLGNDPAVLFFAPMAYGPGNPSTLYFATDRLYRSSNGGLAMVPVSQPLALWPDLSSVAISAIAVSPQDDNVRIAGLVNGKVFATTTGANPMTDVSGSLPAEFTGDVAIDPNDKNTAYVSFSGFGLAAGQHVWKTTNLAGGGATWVAAGNGIPDVPVNALVIDPLGSSRLYAGTDIGVYSSADGGTTWSPLGTGMPRVPVFDLDIQSASRVLRAATHGRGIWELSIGAAYPALDVAAVSAVPITGNGNAFIEPGENGAMTVQLTNHGVVASTGTTVTITTTTAGITILNGTASVSDIAAGATSSNGNPLTFSVGSSVACGSPVNFVITANAAGATPMTRNTRVVLGGPAASPVTFTYSGGALAIPDDNLNGVGAPVAVSGLSTPVSKVTLTIGGTSCNTVAGSPTVGITHGWVDQLQLYLVSPAGTIVPLTVNDGGSGVNFCNTLFDDAAPATLSASGAVNPFSGSFKPVSPLSAFNGENGNGTWQLKAMDVGVYGNYTGSIQAFSIAITPAACGPSCPAIPITPATLPTATTGASYSQTLSASGGVAPYTFSTSSILPAGLTLTAGGLLSGTPTQTGSFSLMISATDSNGCIGEHTYTLLIGTPLSAPSTITATASSTTSVTVTWSTVTGADHYEVWRSSNNGGFVSISTPAAPPLTDTGNISAMTTYLYEVRAVSATTVSNFSVIDPATTIVFSNDPPSAGVTPVRAAHINELRSAVNAMLQSAGQSPVSFADPSLSTSTPIRAVHIAELRAALATARTAMGLPTVFTDDPIVAGTTVVKAVHVRELRDAMR